jgi:transcriptional regulator with XRE-family HTH domain
MFDKKRCIGNIYFLAKDQRKKIGDIEKQAGVSAGYISRLNKDENNTNPGIEFLAAMANELGVLLDDLINYDFEAITPTESYIKKFAERLLNQTKYHEMVWHKELEHALNNMGLNEYGLPYHSLYTVENGEHCGEEGYPYLEAKYNSLFLPGEKIVIAGDGYHTSMPGDAIVYLMKVRIESDMDDMSFGSDDVYELYLVNNDTVEPLCHSGKFMDTPFATVLKNLYQAVVKSGKHAKIKPAVKNILDAFMNETASSEM